MDDNDQLTSKKKKTTQSAQIKCTHFLIGTTQKYVITLKIMTDLMIKGVYGFIYLFFFVFGKHWFDTACWLVKNDFGNLMKSHPNSQVKQPAADHKRWRLDFQLNRISFMLHQWFLFVFVFFLSLFVCFGFSHWTGS